MHAAAIYNWLMNYKKYPCKLCGEIKLSIKNKSGLCRSCYMLGNKRTLGLKHSDKTKKLQSLLKLGNKNPYWKGDLVGNSGLHAWVSRHYPKKEKCEYCNDSPPRDLANIGGYTRDFSNWKWLCRRCHMLSDGRMKNLKNNEN